MNIKRNYNIAAIPTVYKGIKFRSKIEVTWAVFFDELFWPWQYEKQHYKLPSGNYLPDFYFPDIKAHGEVKPTEFTPLERLKCIELSLMFPNTQVLQLISIPTLKPIQIIENGASAPSAIPCALFEKFYPLFYADKFDASYFDLTTKAIFKAMDHFSI